MPSPKILPLAAGAGPMDRSTIWPSTSRLVERVVIALTQQRFPDHSQDVIVIVVSNVEREIAIDPLQSAGPIQRSRAAGPDTVFDRVFSQVLDDMACPAARQSGLLALSGLPQARDVLQP